MSTLRRVTLGRLNGVLATATLGRLGDGQAAAKVAAEYGPYAKKRQRDRAYLEAFEAEGRDILRPAEARPEAAAAVVAATADLTPSAAPRARIRKAPTDDMEAEAMLLALLM